MAAFQGKLGLVRHVAQYRHAAFFLDEGSQQGHEALSAAVDNHAGHRVGLSELDDAPQGGHQGEAGTATVGNEHYGSVGCAGHVVGGSGGGGAAQAVIVTHDAFQHCQGIIALTCAFCNKGTHLVFRGKIQVQVAAGGVQYRAVKHGVNVVGAALVGGHGHAATFQAAQQAAGHRGFA